MNLNHNYKRKKPCTSVTIKVLCFLFVLLPQSDSPASGLPPQTDYCEMLARDIQGKGHGFLAGNLLYYVGGQADAEWNIIENETLGFTHPFFRDGRARGIGIATTQYGTGNNKWGWEFWRRTRGAYGKVIVNGKQYPYPIPKEMIWRPDRHFCQYEVDGVTLWETKFIAKNDVLCSIITSDRPVVLEFDGHSFVDTRNIPTFDKDPAHTPMSQKRTATARYDSQNNAIYIAESGTAIVKPNWGEPAIEGKMMYDGMSVVLSSNIDIRRSHTIERDAEGRQAYKFQVPCDKDGIVLVYAMGDDYKEVLSRVKDVLANPHAALEAKTGFVNNLLNYQIPYFRCSDPDVVKVYYYLWSLYFMYFVDVGKGWECYPHTQTAVNNFMGLHRWDSSVYVPMGSWVADKEKYGYGNFLAWKAMLPFKKKGGKLPDNFGIAWYSPVWGNLTQAAERAWQLYEHSGDLDFLKEAYSLCRELYWSEGPGFASGVGINMIDNLKKMASSVGAASDIKHWRSMRADLVKGFMKGWEINTPHYYGSTATWKDLPHLFSMMCSEMPDTWVDAMVRHWVMNTETGFMGPVPLDIRPPDCIENGVFAVSTISTYFVIEGMFRHHRDAEAIHCTLGHIDGMLKDFGYPIAPECWDPDYKPWGDMYYNWDGAMVLPLIERLIGVQYSLPDNSFTICDHLPEEWDYIKSIVPVVIDKKIHWVNVSITRNQHNGKVEKSVSVKDNPLKKTIIQPWLEGRELLSTKSASQVNAPRGHITFAFQKQSSQSVSLQLGRKKHSIPLLVRITPTRGIDSAERSFVESVEVKLTAMVNGSELHYTVDGTEATTDSSLYTGPFVLRDSATVTARAFRKGDSPGPVTTAIFKKVNPLQSEKPVGFVHGLNYQCFAGKWKRLPAFDKLEPVKTGTVSNFDISASHRDEEFGLVFTGFVKVPRDGFYTFYTRSNDGSRIYIGETVVVDLNIWRNHIDPLEKYGSIALKAGFHPIKVAYYQDYGRKHLQIFYKGPGVPKKQIIPDTALYRQSSNE